MLTLLLLTAAPVALSSKTDLLDFEYRWSAEVNSVPALRRRFRADAARQKAKGLAIARADREARLRSGGARRDWTGHMFSRSWTTAGSTPRLLSLEAETGAYTGGAHGNRGTSTLLWDRRRGREIGWDAVLLRANWWNGAIRQPFCTLLNRERSKRRQEPVQTGDPFWNCPELREVTRTLEDRDRNGRLDHVRITADPYVAGAYAEGDYVVSLPITTAMLARVKPEYRASFEAQPPVQ